MRRCLLLFDSPHGDAVRQRTFGYANLARLHDRAFGKLEGRKRDIVFDDSLILLVEGEGPLPLRVEQEFERTVLHPFDVLAEPRFDLLALRHALPTSNVNYPTGFDD